MRFVHPPSMFMMLFFNFASKLIYSETREAHTWHSYRIGAVVRSELQHTIVERADINYGPEIIQNGTQIIYFDNLGDFDHLGSLAQKLLKIVPKSSRSRAHAILPCTANDKPFGSIWQAALR